MKTRVVLSVAAAGLLAAACGSSDSSTPPATTTGQITLRGLGGTATETFNGPHAGRPLRAALVRWSDGTTLDLYKGSVAASGDPAFVVTFAPSVDLSVPYKVRYWIDHNSGQPNDSCDAPPADHQWEVDTVTGQTLVAVKHSTAFTNVCDTFSFPLTFRGTTTFNGPHANNLFQAALVKGGATTPLEVKSGTVAAAGTDPAFLVTFAPRLFIGESYAVKLWIDSNTQSGAGVCDAPALASDHQWSVPIETGLGAYQPTVPYAHNINFTDVCSFFP